jgi:hypothetical protein
MDRLTHGLAFALCLTKSSRAAARYGFLPPNSEDEHGGQSHGQSRHQDRERQQRDSFVESHLKFRRTRSGRKIFPAPRSTRLVFRHPRVIGF